MSAAARHSARTGEHGTPPDVVELVRTVLGGVIELDPASSAEFNKTVRAERFFTADDNGLEQELEAKTAMINPPGSCPTTVKRTRNRATWKRHGCDRSAVRQRPADKTSERWDGGSPPPCLCKLVPRFWLHVLDAWGRRRVKSVVWIGYSLDQLQTLQGCEGLWFTQRALTPLSFPMCVPSRRLQFNGSSPTHANYITLLPGHPRQEVLFREIFAELGEVRL